MADEKRTIHMGHRDRIRQRLRTAGLEAFSEHEVLELLLTFAIPRRDVNPLAHELISVFGSLSAVLDAPERELMRVKGMGEHAALLLTMMPQLMRRYQMDRMGSRPRIMSTADARAYCAPLFIGAAEEQVYMVCLNQAGDVLHCSLLHMGTVDQVALHPRTVVETALRHHAHSVILAHNHPGGTSEPSKADVEITGSITTALYLIGISLVDHLIFAGGEAYSMIRKRMIAVQEDFCYVRNMETGRLQENQYEWIGFEVQMPKLPER